MAANAENKSYIVLAFNKMSEGIFPWNMNDKELNNYGFVETIHIEGINLTAISSNTLSENTADDTVLAEEMPLDEGELKCEYRSHF